MSFKIEDCTVRALPEGNKSVRHKPTGCEVIYAPTCTSDEAMAALRRMVERSRAEPAGHALAGYTRIMRDE